MKYLKNFNEMITEGREIYNKADMIEFILADMGVENFDKEDQDNLRKELEQTPRNEFDNMALQLGYKQISNGHWI